VQTTSCVSVSISFSYATVPLFPRLKI
jgi:hypothetical protein